MAAGSISGGARVGATDGGVDVGSSDAGDGGLHRYSRRMGPLLAQLAASESAAAAAAAASESGGSGLGVGVALPWLGAGGIAPSTTAGTATGAAAAAARASAARLEAAADAAAKDGDVAAGAALRATAAVAAAAIGAHMGVQPASVVGAPGSPACAAGSSEDGSLALAVRAALVDAGFDAGVCTQAVLATAPTGESTRGLETSPSSAEAPATAAAPPSAASSPAHPPLSPRRAAALADWTERALEWALVATEDEQAAVPASHHHPHLHGGSGGPTAASAATAASSSSSSSAWARQPDPAAALQPHKLVIVVRGDLGMSPGKVAAQCCHAALKAAIRRDAGAGGGDAAALAAWRDGGEPIVVLRCADEAELGALTAAAAAVGLRAARVRDAGRTQVAAGSTTCAAFGPAPAPHVDAVTGHLRLY